MELNPKKIIKSDIYALDLETTGLESTKDKILVVSLSTPTHNYVWEYSKYPKVYWNALFSELATSFVIGQNIKFDMGFIYAHHGIMLQNVWDTHIADQVLYNGLGYAHGLYDIIERELKITVGNKEEKKLLQLSFTKMAGNALSEKQLKYACDDTSYLIELYKVQDVKIKTLELDKIMKLEMKLEPVLTGMETFGCRIDREAWTLAIEGVWKREIIRYEDLLDNEINKLGAVHKVLKKRFKPRNRRVEILYDLFGTKTDRVLESANCINYGSSAQILELFRLLDQVTPTVTEDTDEGKVIKESVGEGALDTYVTENPDSILKEFLRLLIKYREYKKLCSTYGYEFLAKLDKDDYIHTTYSQCRTATGRLSSSGPNLQNIPSMDSQELDELFKRYDIVSDIRNFFLPDEGDVMITADMSGAEIRIAADHSGDEKLINSILLDEDLHSKLASVSYSIIFGEPVEISKSKDLIFGYPAKTLRDTHKSVLFAKFYKGGAKRIYEVLSEYICKFNPASKHKAISNAISVAIDKELPALSDYLSSLIDEAQANGMLRGSKLGRIRYFNRETVYGDAANMPIQNINAEACKIAMIKIAAYLADDSKGRVVLQVHDEVVCSVRKIHAEEAAKFIQQTMADSLSFFLTRIKGDSTVEIAEHWKK